MSEVNAIVAWTFMSEIQIPQDVAGMMVHGEQPVAAFATFRDAAIFTTKRLIVRDAQGLTGKKVEVYSLPYSAIHMWSSENAGAGSQRGDRTLDTGGQGQDQGRQAG